MESSLWNHIGTRLAAFGVEAREDNTYLYLIYQGVTSRFRKTDSTEDAFESYTLQTNRHFDEKDWYYSYDNKIDIPLVRLDQGAYREDTLVLSGDQGDQIIIQRAALSYSFAHFDSSEYELYFQRYIAARLKRESVVPRSILLLWRRPMVATYSSLLAESEISLRYKGLERIRACLLKLAVETESCFEIAPAFSTLKPQDTEEVSVTADYRIPNVSYDRNLVNYYKVGKASPFASQAYLSYYHVLEYYFLRVAEDSLHHRLRALLNSPSFYSTADGLDRTISMVRKHDANDDETEMLRKVLAKFVSEEDFIVFVNAHEKSIDEKIYSKRHKVFGEDFDISLREGHALSNAAKVLKHIRNAIVHSSDKYSRDECHIPLTESEGVIEKYIPLVMYFAEQVLFATAQPMRNEIV